MIHFRGTRNISIILNPYNKGKERTTSNTRAVDFNCGGYALGTMSWYGFNYWHGYWFNDEQDNKKRIDDCAEILLNEFPDLRRINSLNEVGKNEYAIALRFTKDMFLNDFHFIKRGRNGQWYQKCGACHGIERVSEEYVFSEQWVGDYVGIIALFAKKV